MVTSMRLAITLFSMMCFISTAFGSCGVKDLVIGTERSGREIKGKPEWNVQIINTCNCSLSNVVLTCPDFQTVEPIDPSIFRKAGNICSVNGGQPLQPQADIRFSYAWDPPFFLFPSSAANTCS